MLWVSGMYAQPAPLPALASPDGSAWTVRVIDRVFEAATCRELIERQVDQRWLTRTADFSRTPLGPVDLLRRFAEPDLPCRLLGDDEPPPFTLIDDPKLALRLFYRLAPSLPEVVDGAQLVGLKPLLRCSCLSAGQGTELHRDPSRVSGEGMRSRLSAVVFLNDDFVGGGLEFPRLHHRVSPRVGRAVLFDHGLEHRDLAVEVGRAFVLQAEVFYSERWQPLRSV